MESTFEIVRDYPDSLCALRDLKACLDQSGEHEELVVSISKAVKDRLLIIDAKTQSILDMYLSINKCLQFLKLSDVTIPLILTPIKKYLTYLLLL